MGWLIGEGNNFSAKIRNDQNMICKISFGKKRHKEREFAYF